MRRTHDAGLKAKVALEATKGEKTVAEISSKYGIHPNQISKWKKEVLERLPELFNGKIKKREKTADELQAELYQQIGQLTDWLSSIGHHINHKRVEYAGDRDTGDISKTENLDSE